MATLLQPVNPLTALTPAIVSQITDRLAGGYIALYGTSAGGSDSTFGYGCGDVTLALGSDWGVSKAFRTINQDMYGTNVIPGWGNADLVNFFAPSYNSAIRIAPTNYLTKILFGGWINTLSDACSFIGISGITDLDSFLTYYNIGAGGANQCLVSPAFAVLYSLAPVGNVLTLTPTNIYSPPLSNFGQKSVGGSFSPGSSINSSLYAGAGVAQIVGTGITASSGGVITVTGSARKADGTVASGRTFTASVATSPSSQTLTLVPTVTGDLLLSVTGISLPGGLSGGTFTVNGYQPSGRQYPPS